MLLFFYKRTNNALARHWALYTYITGTSTRFQNLLSDHALAASRDWAKDAAEKLAFSNEDELREHCYDKVTRYKVPRRIVAMDELPRTMLGKTLRRAVKEQIVQEKLLDR